MRILLVLVFFVGCGGSVDPDFCEESAGPLPGEWILGVEAPEECAELLPAELLPAELLPAGMRFVYPDHVPESPGFDLRGLFTEWCGGSYEASEGGVLVVSGIHANPGVVSGSFTLFGSCIGTITATKQ